MAPSRPARPTFEFKDAKLSPPRSPWRRAQVRARQQFLDTVHRLEPAVLASLNEAPAAALREVPTTSLDQGESLSWKHVTSLAANNDASVPNARHVMSLGMPMAISTRTGCINERCSSF